MSKKILVVDNNPVILELLSHHFSELGHEVFTAHDGLSALARLDDCIPDVIFVDLVMPNISGDKLCRIIRAMPGFRHIYIVVLSAIVVDEEIDFKEFGADACIAKGPLTRMQENIAEVLKAAFSRKKDKRFDKAIGLDGLHEREITKELLQAKHNFEVILRNMDEGVVQMTRERRIIFANSRAAELFESPEETLLSSDFLSYFTGDSRKDIGEMIVTWPGEPRHLGDDSPLFLNDRRVSMSILPVHEAEIDSLIVILHDITRRKKAEDEVLVYQETLEDQVRERTMEIEEINQELEQEIRRRKEIEKSLRESEHKYRFLVENQTDLVVTLDKDLHLLFVSPSYCKTFGRPEQDFLDKAFIPLVHEEDRRAVESALRSLKQPPYTGYHEERAMTTGGWRWFGWAARAIIDEAGDISSIISVGRDITESKQASKELREAKERYQELFEKHPLPMWVYDLETLAFLAVNDAAVAHYGYGRDEFLQMTIKDIRPADDVPDLLENVAGVTSGIDKAGVWRHLKKDGSMIYVEITSHIMDFMGRPGEVVLANDVTDTILVQEKLRQSRDELEHRVVERTVELEKVYRQLLHAEKLSAIGKLSASIAHEFNNPICGIRNVLEGLQRRVELDRDNDNMVRLAIRECDRVAKLTSDLQSFNRPTTGKFTEVDIHVALEEILMLIKKELKNRKIRLVKEYGHDIPRIRAIKDQVKQVLLNLLTNAGEAIGEKGGRITIGTERLGSRVAVHIKDTGVGIVEEDMAHIFEPFFSTKPEVKGTGLGLSVSYGIVKSHGGSFSVESEPGRGALFSVILPIDGGGA